MSSISLTEFGTRLVRSGRAKRIPTSCLFEITPTCNLRCQFCYIALDPYKGPYLSTAQICAILDRIEEAGVLWLTLTGGEIFSRRDFEEIYRYAWHKGFLVRLYTNATLVSEEVAGLFAELPPYEVEVSIYGADAEHYEATTQIPGSFARFERGIRRLMEAKVRLRLKTPVSKITQDHLPQLAEYCRSLGVPYALEVGVDYHYDGEGQPELYRITPRRVPEMYQQIDRLRDDWERARHEARRDVFTAAQEAVLGDPVPACEDVADGNPSELYQCGAGRTTFFVDALGNCSHCVIDREPSFPILSMPWADLWERMGNWVTQPMPESAPCNGCSLRGECQNCPARSRMATGSPYLKDPYFCDVTHAMHGLPPVDHPDYRAMRRPLGACAT